MIYIIAIIAIILFFVLATGRNKTEATTRVPDNRVNLKPSIVEDNFDLLFSEAARIIVKNQVASASIIQRKLQIGYNRASRILDQLELAGFVGPNQGSKPRQLKITSEIELEKLLMSLNDEIEFHNEEPISVANTINQSSKVSDYYSFLESIYSGSDLQNISSSKVFLGMTEQMFNHLMEFKLVKDDFAIQCPYRTEKVSSAKIEVRRRSSPTKTSNSDEYIFINNELTSYIQNSSET